MSAGSAGSVATTGLGTGKAIFKIIESSGLAAGAPIVTVGATIAVIVGDIMGVKGGKIAVAVGNGRAGAGGTSNMFAVLLNINDGGGSQNGNCAFAEDIVNAEIRTKLIKKHAIKLNFK